MTKSVLNQQTLLYNLPEIQQQLMKEKQATTLPYLMCPIHSGQYLSMVCIEPGCPRPGLLCNLCLTEHTDHLTVPLKHLLKGLQHALSFSQTEQDCCDKLQQLQLTKQSMLYMLKQCVQQLADKFQQLQQTIIDSHNKIKLEVISQIQIIMKTQKLIADTIKGPIDRVQFVQDMRRVAQWIQQKQGQFHLNLQLEDIVKPFNNMQGQMEQIVENSNIFAQKWLKLSLQEKILSKGKQTYRFSPSLKAASIKIMDQGKRAKQTNTNPGRFVLIDQGIGLKNQRIVFRVTTVKNWVGVGICCRSKITGVSYQFKYETLGHGCYLLSNNGYSWSHSIKEDNVHQCGNEVEVILSAALLTFRVRNSNKDQVSQYSMKIDYKQQQWGDVCFCANLCSAGDQIQILDS